MNYYFKILVMGWVAAFFTLASVSANQRPNVLYILADDIGWGDVGAYHEAQTGTAPVVPTPNLDALARDGIMFNDAHTPAALCAPTRFSLLTGSNPVRNGRPWGTWGLSSSSAFSAGGSHDTLGDVMQRADYRTSFFGKMHFGGNPKDANGNVTHNIGSIDFSRPISDGLSAHGFDYSYGMHSGIQNPPYVFYENDMFAPIDPNKPADNSSIREWAPGTYSNPDGTESVILDNSSVRPGDVDWDSSRVGDLLSQKAVNFIDDHLQQNATAEEDKPFFMFYASQGIHVPHTPVNQLDGTSVRGTTFNSKTDMIKELDLQVGRIVEKLESEGLADDTLIMFTSDNGGLPGFGGGELEAGHDSVGPLRGFKGGPYEGGQRVPFIAKWGDGTPAGSYIQPGTTSEQLVMAQDWAATLYDLTRQNMPASQAQDSTTLLPTLFGRQTENDPLRTFAVMQSRTAAEEQRPHMLRMDDGEGEWVLILNRSREGVQLYNLTMDLGQQTDLINDPSQQDRIASMQALFRQHDQQSDARGTAAFSVANATLFPGETEPPEVANTISVNLTNGNQSVTTPYGVVESSVWTNSSANNISNVVDDTGSATSLDVAVAASGGRGNFGGPYVGTPLNSGPQFFGSSSPSVTLSEIPYEEYMVAVYLTGFNGNPGSMVTDGTTTYYWDTSQPANATLIETTDTDAGNGIDFGKYAIFGSEESPLTDDTLTLTFGLFDSGLSGGGGVGGFQVIEILSSLAGDFDDDGDVDGQDFLMWQRGESTNPLSSSDLTEWQNNFASSSQLAATASNVPEPSTLLIVLIGCGICISTQRA